MSKSPEIVIDAGNIHTYVLEWIVRCHPDFLLPLSCKTDGSTTRIFFHTEGLVTLEEYAGAYMEEQPRPAEWIACVLDAIRRILALSDDHLLGRNLFQLDTHSVWLRISDPPNTNGASPANLQPVLTCLPVADAVPKGDLAGIAMGLLTIAEKFSQPDHSDSALLGLKVAASHGIAALCDHLDDLACQKAYPGNPGGVRIQLASSMPDTPVVSGMSRKNAVLAMWIALTVILTVIPLFLRFGPEPYRMFDDSSTTRYQRVVSSVLGVMAITDSLLLFAPFSPLRIPVHSSKYSAKLRSFRQEIRTSGLLSALASRLGKSGKWGAPTSPVAFLPGSERLGFLSEGEPGTLNESQGIRAYLLTAEFLVGRDPDMADLVVPDPSIGRVHARINRIEGVFFLTDLGSVNGTCLDGSRLDRHVQTVLPDKCRISFAERSFYFIAD